jgi:hypothetical protein
MYASPFLVPEFAAAAAATTCDRAAGELTSQPTEHAGGGRERRRAFGIGHWHRASRILALLLHLTNVPLTRRRAQSNTKPRGASPASKDWGRGLAEGTERLPRVPTTC